MPVVFSWEAASLLANGDYRIPFQGESDEIERCRALASGFFAEQASSVPYAQLVNFAIDGAAVLVTNVTPDTRPYVELALRSAAAGLD